MSELYFYAYRLDLFRVWEYHCRKFVPLSSAISHKNCGVSHKKIVSYHKNNLQILFLFVKSRIGRPKPYYISDRVCPFLLPSLLSVSFSSLFSMFLRFLYLLFLIPLHPSITYFYTGWTQKHSMISSSYKIKTYCNILTKLVATVA